MVKSYPTEQWKEIQFDYEYINENKLEISNFGRIRSFNKQSDGNLIKGSLVNGYKIIRLKLYTPREPKVQAKLDQMHRKVFKLAKDLKTLKENKESEKLIDAANTELADLKATLKELFKSDTKSRTINTHMLVHRMVAKYFLKKPTSKQTVVAHLDYDKLNNEVSNLKWMEHEESYIHQNKSPNVIKTKEDRRLSKNNYKKTTKLTTTKVMYLKKLLNEGVPINNLVKKFKVTNTQIWRIKRGENWADVPASK